MYHLYFLILTFLGPLLLFAQTTKPNPPPFTYKVNTLEGIEYSGTIITVNAIAISLQQNKERILVKKDEVVSISLTGERITNTGKKPEVFQKIRTVDEKSFKGQLISYNGTDYIFLTHKDYSIASFPDSVVRMIKLVPSNKRIVDKMSSINPPLYLNQQRFYFTPSAFLLEKGFSEIRSSLFADNVFNYGVSKNLTVGGGVNHLWLIDYGIGPTGTIKFGGSIGEFIHLATGAIGMVYKNGGFYKFDSGASGTVYGSFAVGTRAHFLSVSAGWTYEQSRRRDSRLYHYQNNYYRKYREYTERIKRISISMGGSFRFAKHWRFFIEGFDVYLYSHDANIYGSSGISWFRNQHQLDVGVFPYPPIDDGGNTFLIPILGYSFKF